MATPWSRNQKIAVWAGAAAVVAALAALGRPTFEVQKLNLRMSQQVEDERRAKVIEWQKVVVYNILQTRMLKDRMPMTFDEIRSEYVIRATTVNGIDLKKEELQDLALKKILLELMSLQLVYETSGGKYVIQQYSLNMKFDRFSLQSDASDKILNAIDNESGKYTASELDAKLRDELKLTKEEYNRILLELMGYNWISLDANGKLWSRLKPPPPTPKNEE